MKNVTERNTLKMSIVRKRPDDLNRLMCDASSNSIGVERFLNILRYLKKLRLTVKDLGNCDTTLILSLQKLIDNKNPKISKEARDLFNSWIKMYYSSRYLSDASTTCKEVVRLNPTRPTQCVKKKEHLLSHDLAATKSKKSVAHEVKEIKPDVCKSVQTTSRPPLLMKKQHPSLKVSKSVKHCLASKKNSTEMLELFDIAKNSADVANAKGIIMAKSETSICIDTLSLLVSYQISATTPETTRIMERLVFLTKHKDRKICNSALALLKHWRQSISDQQQR